MATVPALKDAPRGDRWAVTVRWPALKDSPRGADGWSVGEWLPGCGRHPGRKASCQDSPALGSRGGDHGAGGGRPGQPLPLQQARPTAQPRGHVERAEADSASGEAARLRTRAGQKCGVRGRLRTSSGSQGRAHAGQPPRPHPARFPHHSGRPQAPLFLTHLLRSNETRLMLETKLWRRCPRSSGGLAQPLPPGEAVQGPRGPFTCPLSGLGRGGRPVSHGAWHSYNCRHFLRDSQLVVVLKRHACQHRRHKRRRFHT